MSLYQRILVFLTLGVVQIIHFFERKLFDFLKLTSLSALNLFIGVFVYLNIGFLSFLISGIVYANSFYSDTFLHNIYTPFKNSGVLGASVVIPSLVRELPVPQISSSVALVVDKHTDTLLYSLHTDQTLASASTTKLMTALISLDLYSLKEDLIVPEFCTAVDGSKVGLVANASYNVLDLVNALLIQSGADAACVLSNSKVTYYGFVELMNKKALEIGMKNTSFTNPIGLDGVNGSHYSTASDLYTLTKIAMLDPIISNIVATKEYKITSSDKSSSINLLNTNKLLWEIPNTVGVKTGTTAAAGEVLIYEYKETTKNIDLVIIVMNSSDRFSDTKNLLTWVLGSYSFGVVTD